MIRLECPAFGRALAIIRERVIEINKRDKKRKKQKKKRKLRGKREREREREREEARRGR